MKIFIAGASGATGRLLVAQLLKRDHEVKVLVRSNTNLSRKLENHKNLTVVYESILNLDTQEMANLVHGYDAVVSCLGHNLSFSGIFGAPRELVTEATRRLCDAIRVNNPVKPVKFILMNTTGNRNRDLNEQISFAERCVIGLIRLLLPPHRDNEKAADYLRTQIGQKDDRIEWVVVRPALLIDELEVSDYNIHPSPTRSAIFGGGKTSRINVGHLMADLIINGGLWKKWQGKMPVIYNNI
ncbi:MAG: NAD(P)-binding oxidoreductase [Emcibacteraceae bacterium]